MRRLTQAMTLCLATFGMLALSTQIGTDPAHAQAATDGIAYYEKNMKRPSLFKRAMALERLAGAKNEKSSDLLFKRYEAPIAKLDELPEIRHLVADVAWRAGSGPHATKVYGKWLKKFKKREDVWLWFNLQRTLAEHASAKEVAEDIARSGDMLLRAAALEGMARTGAMETLDTITGVLSERLPSKDIEKRAIVEACASALMFMKEKRKEDTWRKAANLVIKQLEGDDHPETTKLVVARHLAQAFGTTRVDLTPYFWYELLESGTESNPGEQKKSGTKSSFAGIEGSGKRVVFIIDMSTSMLQPLSAAEKESAKGGEVTGEGRKEEKSESDDLPWDKIKTRYDLAREYLKRAIRGLDEDTAFVVVWFKNRAEYLDGFSGMHFATDTMKKQAITAIDKASPPEDPNKGFTNVHGGYLLAFRALAPDEKKADKAKKKNEGGGVIEGNEDKDESVFERGADTIFFLSDGAPSWDNYDKVDSRDPEDNAGNPETGQRSQNTPNLHFMGPYGRGDNVLWLVRDIQRMNLLRKAELHCVGVGEARADLLNMISQVGLGKTKILGGQQGQRGPGQGGGQGR